MLSLTHSKTASCTEQNLMIPFYCLYTYLPLTEMFLLLGSLQQDVNFMKAGAIF